MKHMADLKEGNLQQNERRCWHQLLLQGRSLIAHCTQNKIYCAAFMIQNTHTHTNTHTLSMRLSQPPIPTLNPLIHKHCQHPPPPPQHTHEHAGTHTLLSIVSLLSLSKTCIFANVWILTFNFDRPLLPVGQPFFIFYKQLVPLIN